MKKNKILSALAFILVLTASSCEDYLDTSSKSAITPEVTFASTELTKKAIDGIIVSMAETESYRGRFLTWYGMNSDIEWYNTSTNNDDKAKLATYMATPGNKEMDRPANAWAKMYEGIEKANLCITGIRNNGISHEAGTEFGHLLAEALTLRAVLYSDLVKAWGDVPARFEPLTNATIYKAKSDRDVIYKQIITDLEEAADLAYWPLQDLEYTKEINRINKTFVKGLLGRVCLDAAGYSQRPGFDNPRLSNDPELSKEVLYPLAKKHLLEAFGYHGEDALEKSFEGIFKKLCAENYLAGGEGLWNIPMSEGRGRMAYTFGIRHRTPDQYTKLASGGQVGPTPHLFYDYDINDTRRDVTCIPYEWSQSNPAKQQLRALNSWCFGKYRYEWMTRIVTSSSDDGLQKQYMRYAEIILMLAEIENQLPNGNSSDAANYLKMIRRRAFPQAMWATKVDQYVDSKNTRDKMFDAIVDEYSFEFAGEMIRKETLIRWNLLGDKLADSKVRMEELRNQTGRYADVPSKLYWKYAADGETLLVYGLNRGENMDMSAIYTNTLDWVSPGKINDVKINSLYSGDPDNRQFWPIWTVFIGYSNGMLENSYGY